MSHSDELPSENPADLPTDSSVSHSLGGIRRTASGSETSAMDTDDSIPPFEHPVLVAAVFEGGLALLALAIGWLLGYPLLPWIDGSRAALFMAVVATLPLVAGLLLLDRFPVGPFRDLKHVVDRMLVPLFRDCSLVQFAIISFLAGLGEEMLFRWLIQGKLTDWLLPWLGLDYGPAVALVLASALFGLMHPITKLYAAICFVMGLYLGWLFLYTDNLVIPILVHALYDFVALVYLVRTQGRVDAA